MNVIFESTIKSSGEKPNDWYIELKYLDNNTIKNSTSITEYEKDLNEICNKEGILIESNENKWIQDSNITSEQYAQINSQMRKVQGELNNVTDD